MTNLTYDRVEQALAEAVPEVRGEYDGYLRRTGFAPTGPYSSFMFTLEPVLKPVLNSGDDPALLKRIFDFFEMMARSSDIQVPNLLQVGILEWLVGDKSRLSVAWRYMGEETKKLARGTARTLRCGENLPSE